MNDFETRKDIMFPALSNKVEEVTNENTLAATQALWKGVSEKVAVAVEKTLAPLEGVIMDIKTDYPMINADACPVVQVEVIDSMGEALVDATSWDASGVRNHYANVQLHRISRPFSLTAYDLQRGERVESKICAAAEVVAQGVVAQLAAAIEDIAEPTMDDFGPEKAAQLSGVFDKETNALILSPAAYAKIVPTSGFALDPSKDGSYGINKILKSTGLGDILALTKDAIAGAIVTPAVLSNHGGNMDVREIGNVNGFPMILKTCYDWNETLKCSVEVMAGFAVANESGIKRYALA